MHGNIGGFDAFIMFEVFHKDSGIYTLNSATIGR